MKGYAVAIGALSVIVMVTISVIIGFKSNLFGGANCTATPGAVDCKLNETADAFTSGLTIFATFIGVVILALIGKIIVGLYKGGM